MWFFDNDSDDESTLYTMDDSSYTINSGSDPVVQQLLEDQAERFKTNTDVRFLLEDPAKFAKLKENLRRSGAITNITLKHGIHFYARDHGTNSGKGHGNSNNNNKGPRLARCGSR